MIRIKAAIRCLLGEPTIYGATIVIHGSSLKTGDKFKGFYPVDSFSFIELKTNGTAYLISCKIFTPEGGADKDGKNANETLEQKIATRNARRQS